MPQTGLTCVMPACVFLAISHECSINHGRTCIGSLIRFTVGTKSHPLALANTMIAFPSLLMQRSEGVVPSTQYCHQHHKSHLGGVTTCHVTHNQAYFQTKTKWTPFQIKETPLWLSIRNCELCLLCSGKILTVDQGIIDS